MKRSRNTELEAVLCLLYLILIATFPTALAGSGRLSGMIIGSPGGVLINPFRVLSVDDPMLTLDVYPIPWSLPNKDKRKLDRVYFPRTRRDLLDYDLMVFHAPYVEHLISKHVHDLDYAFREAEMAAFCGLTGMITGWTGPVLTGVIPINEREVSPYSRSYTPKFRDNRDPVFTPFLEYGIGNVFGNIYTEMYPKQGSTVWADIVPYNLPWLVSWRPAGGNPGMLWNVAHIFDIWWDENNNPYVMDVATNMIFYSLDMGLISDIPARREARLMFRSFRSQVSLILSMMNWADSFGANTDHLSEKLTLLENEAKEAEVDYISQDYGPAISFLESLSEEVKVTTQEAVDLKNEALLWVYLVEWLAVSGTSAGCGFVLWTLMVRRKTFKEVETTRLPRLSR